MTTREKVQFVAVRSLGNFLLLMCLYGVFATFGPLLMQEVRYRVDKAKGVTYKVSVQQPGADLYPTPAEEDKVTLPASGAFQAIMDNTKDRIIIPSDTLFSVLIPSIGASAKVYPNVDPANDQEFNGVLKKGIAHAKGTVFPGMPGNTYLFAHSTDNWWNVGRFNAVFYLLKDVEVGDEIIVFFENKRYNYTVTGKYVADPSVVSFLTDKGDKEQLILQTCWPPGTTWRRLFVIAEPK